MDHKHRLKSEKIGKDGKGLLRGVLDFRANSFEGRVLKLYKRSGLLGLIDLPGLLRNTADYNGRCGIAFSKNCNNNSILENTCRYNWPTPFNHFNDSGPVFKILTFQS